MRKALFIAAFLNMLAMVGLIFALSLWRGTSWLWITDNAQRLEQVGAVDYAKLNAAIDGTKRMAGREDLEHVMGIGNTRYFGTAATDATMLMVVQTVTLVSLGLMRFREPPVSGGQAAAPPPPGDVPGR